MALGLTLRLAGRQEQRFRRSGVEVVGSSSTGTDGFRTSLTCLAMAPKSIAALTTEFRGCFLRQRSFGHDAHAFRLRHDTDEFMSCPFRFFFNLNMRST